MGAISIFFHNLFGSKKYEQKDKLEVLHELISHQSNEFYRETEGTYRDLHGIQSQIEQLASLFGALYDVGIEKQLFTKDEFKHYLDLNVPKDASGKTKNVT